ncbi:IS630 transposase-related protein [Wolbachia endosymbiont of Tetranychus urticae]|uniref:IS630 transposase-related protein n=1 Tax=Wolbachia endosymbiont of Tetranychus urticae TaxID=169184 RepID=UPI00397A19B3
MAYSVDLREKAVLMIEKGKTKVEIAELMEIGIATLYRWLKKKAAGESLKPSKTVALFEK